MNTLTELGNWIWVTGYPITNAELITLATLIILLCICAGIYITKR